MTKNAVFLITLSIATSPCQAQVQLPTAGAGPELAASLLLALAALLLAYAGLRRGIVNAERARTLQRQLEAEREARDQSDQALAANHEVLYRLVRQHEDVREGERRRIGCDLQSELGRRLLGLRSDLAQLQDTAGRHPGQSMPGRLDGALSDIDGALGALRAVAGGLPGFGPGNGLRHALERCLAEHAHLHGVRYRFDTGVDPAAHGSPDRAARLAVFQVLQEALAASARQHVADLHVRLREGARSLHLDIDSASGMPQPGTGLSEALAAQVRALGGALRTDGDGAGHGGWSLSLPARQRAEAR